MEEIGASDLVSKNLSVTGWIPKGIHSICVHISRTTATAADLYVSSPEIFWKEIKMMEDRKYEAAESSNIPFAKV